MSKHVHIVGCSPRSGTTLLHEAMVTCFDFDNYCEHERSIFGAQEMTGDRVCTKHPLEAPYMPALLRIDKNLHVLYLQRDPRNVVVSKHASAKTRYFSHLKVWQEFDGVRRRLESHPRFTVVDYESFVQNPDAVQDQIQAAMPFLQRKHRFSEFHLHAAPSDLSRQALNGVRPITAKGLNRWREHLPRVKAQIEQFGDVSDTLVELGYEKDHQWLAELDAVTASGHDSAMDDTYRSIHSFKMKHRIARKVFNYALRHWTGLRL